jgi:hypothetical protein
MEERDWGTRKWMTRVAFERRRRTAHGHELGRVRAGAPLVQELVRARVDERAQLGEVGERLVHRGLRAVGRVASHALSVHVERKDAVARGRKLLCPRLFVVNEPHVLVRDEQARLGSDALWNGPEALVGRVANDVVDVAADNVGRAVGAHKVAAVRAAVESATMREDQRRQE